MQQDLFQHDSAQEPSQPLLGIAPQAAKSLGISRALLSTLLVKNKGPPLSNEVRLFVSRRRHCADGLKSIGYRSRNVTTDVNVSSSTLLSLQEEAVQRLNALLLDEQQPMSPVTVNADKQISHDW